MTKQIEKKGSLIAGGGLLAAKGIGGWVAQNLIGKAHLAAKGKQFNRDLGGHALAGAMGKNSDRGGLIGKIKGISSSIFVPEVPTAHNQMFSTGSKLVKDYAAQGMQSKRNLVVMKRAIKGDAKALKRLGISDTEAKAIRKELSGDGTYITQEVMDRVNKLKTFKSPDQMPSGTLTEKARKMMAPKSPVAPSGLIEQGVGAAGSFYMDGATGAMNTAKLALGHDFANKIPGVKKVSDYLTTKPIMDNLKKGYKGDTFDGMANQAKSILFNPYAAKMEVDAHKLGKVVKGKTKGSIGNIDEILSKARGNSKGGVDMHDKVSDRIIKKIREGGSESNRVEEFMKSIKRS